MSMDFDAVCFRCRKYQHLGQDMGCRCSFGYGSNDLEGANEAADFALAHATFCGPVMIMNANDVPEHFLWIPTDLTDADEPGWGNGMPPELQDGPSPSASFTHYQTVLLRVSEFLVQGTDIRESGRVIGAALEDAKPDAENPGKFIVKVAIKHEFK